MGLPQNITTEVKVKDVPDKPADRGQNDKGEIDVFHHDEPHSNAPTPGSSRPCLAVRPYIYQVHQGRGCGDFRLLELVRPINEVFPAAEC
jgi:hypothetical protein